MCLNILIPEPINAYIFFFLNLDKKRECFENLVKGEKERIKCLVHILNNHYLFCYVPWNDKSIQACHNCILWKDGRPCHLNRKYQTFMKQKASGVFAEAMGLSAWLYILLSRFTYYSANKQEISISGNVNALD